MIQHNKIWSLIVGEMKSSHQLDKLTESIMKKIQELDSKNVKSTNK